MTYGQIGDLKLVKKKSNNHYHKNTILLQTVPYLTFLTQTMNCRTAYLCLFTYEKGCILHKFGKNWCRFHKAELFLVKFILRLYY